MSNIYVNCGGSLMKFNNKKDTMDFFEDCIYSSEGSERNRYTTIYFEVKEHFNDNQICFTDGTDHVYDSNINPEDVSHDEEKQLRKYFDIVRKTKGKYFQNAFEIESNKEKEREET